MFRFVFAWTPADTWDAAMAAEGFVGIECAGDGPANVPVVGRRSNATAFGPGRLDVQQISLPDGGAYVALPALAGVSEERQGRLFSQLAETTDRLVLIENGGEFQSAHSLWSLLEAVRHPRVKIAIDVSRAAVADSPAAVLVPTLNLRIGLLRVSENSPDLVDYARRLAGIGFEGWIVIDPPAGIDRIAAAREMAAVFRGIFPTKPAKKAVPAKAAH